MKDSGGRNPVEAMTLKLYIQEYHSHGFLFKKKLNNKWEK